MHKRSPKTSWCTSDLSPSTLPWRIPPLRKSNGWPSRLLELLSRKLLGGLSHPFLRPALRGREACGDSKATACQAWAHGPPTGAGRSAGLDPKSAIQRRARSSAGRLRCCRMAAHVRRCLCLVVKYVPPAWPRCVASHVWARSLVTWHRS